MLIRNAGHVVPRRTLAHFATKRDREIHLNAHIGEIRKALDAQFRARIVTVRNVGYMYQKVPTSMPDLGTQATS